MKRMTCLVMFLVAGAEMIFGSCESAAVEAGDSAAPAAAYVPASGPSADFVPPEWVSKERAAALRGVRVIRDVEYVPGASRIPLADPNALHPMALEYIKAGGKTRAFDIYFPARLADRMPAVVWFHGGPNYGKKEAWCPALVLLTKGYIVVSANYRLRGEAPFYPAAVHDSKAVIRWLRAHAAEYQVDPNHIGAWGHSAGSMLTAWLGVTNGEPSLEGDEGNLQFSSQVQAAVCWSGGSPPAESNRPTPLKFADAKKSAPYLIMHGDADPVVPIRQSQDLAVGLVKAGIECSFIPVRGGTHGIGGPALEQQVIAFFDRHLKPALTTTAPARAPGGTATTPTAE